MLYHILYFLMHYFIVSVIAISLTFGLNNLLAYATFFNFDFMDSAFSSNILFFSIMPENNQFKGFKVNKKNANYYITIDNVTYLTTHSGYHARLRSLFNLLEYKACHKAINKEFKIFKFNGRNFSKKVVFVNSFIDANKKIMNKLSIMKKNDFKKLFKKFSNNFLKKP